MYAWAVGENYKNCTNENDNNTINYNSQLKVATSIMRLNVKQLQFHVLELCGVGVKAQSAVMSQSCCIVVYGSA